MPAWNLELVAIARDWVSSFVMLCQAFSCCLYVALSAFSFVFSEWNAAQSDWLGQCRILHFSFFPSKTPGLLLLYVLDLLPFVFWSAAQSTVLHLTESGQTVYLYTLYNSLFITKHSNSEPLEAMQLMHHTAPHSTTDDVVCFDHELFHTSCFPSFWYRLILISTVQRMLFQKRSGFLDIFWQSLIWSCLQLAVKPLYLLWWSLLLIVDTSASWREFFSWLDVVKERGSSDHHLCVCSGEVFSWL